MMAKSWNAATCMATLYILVVHVRAAHNQSQPVTCSHVYPVFLSDGIGTLGHTPQQPIAGDKLMTCRSDISCCTTNMEEKLAGEVARLHFHRAVQTASNHLRSQLAGHAQRIQEKMVTLISQSLNSSRRSFVKGGFDKLKPAVRPHLDTLFGQMKAAADGQKPALEKLEDSVMAFFNELFPLVYHRELHPKLSELSPEYVKCLTGAQRDLRPFGEIPRELAFNIAHSFEKARSVIDAIHLAVEVLNTTDHLEHHEECYTAVTRMSQCSLCQGLADAKPCQGYCMNVFRGCLAGVVQLDAPWNDFVGAMESVGQAVKGEKRRGHGAKKMLNIEEILEHMGQKIMDGILYSIINGLQLDKRVKRKCGVRRTTRDAPDGVDTEMNIGPSVPTSPSIPPTALGNSFTTEMDMLVATLARSRGFYANLGDAVCNEASLASTNDVDCWNGKQIGEYRESIAGIGLTEQRMNPEMDALKIKDVTLSHLGDKLRHVRQLLSAKLAAHPESDSYRKNEEDEWMEGSGSGEILYPPTYHGPYGPMNPDRVDPSTKLPPEIESHHSLSDDEDTYHDKYYDNHYDDDGSGSGYYSPDDTILRGPSKEPEVFIDEPKEKEGTTDGSSASRLSDLSPCLIALVTVVLRLARSSTL